MIEAAEHFEDLRKQTHAARLGMWAFLSSEALLFAGLFALYAAYRAQYHAEFHQAGEHMEVVIGTVNTFILLTSSLTVALSLWAVRNGRNRTGKHMLAVTLLLALAFLVLKFVEYGLHFREGIYPGIYYHSAALPSYGAHLFFTLYFFMTGLHALHVTAGMAVLVWCYVQVTKGRWSREYSTGLELGAMYWHLVDLIWIFLWPILYLVD
jgi:cytochrome c oxidase subunit 3